MMHNDTLNTGNKEVGTETVTKFIYKDDAAMLQDSFGQYLEYNQTRLDDIRTQIDKIGETIDGYVSEAIGVKL